MPRSFFFFLLLALSQTAALASNILDDWSSLPPNRLGGNIKTESFNTAWPSNLSFGENGFVILGSGSFGQFSLLKITASGECTFIFLISDHDNSSVVWRKATFHISSEAVTKLLTDLESAGVSKLQKSYVDSSFADGGQALFSFSDGSTLRSVWMNNSFPNEFRRIILLTAHLIDTQHLSLIQAPLSTHEASRTLYHQAFPKGVE